MGIWSHLAVAAGKTSQWVLQTSFKDGNSYPGKLALGINSKILDALAKDYGIIVVTGTNSKTLITALTVNILRQELDEVLTNPAGANMEQGIVSTFLDTKVKKGQKKFAVLEIDEVDLSRVAKYIQPRLFVFTNIFRNRMDRCGEIYTTYRLIVEGAIVAPEATILCNGDSPIFNSKETVNPRKYYRFNHLPSKEQLAHYSTDGVLCPKCNHILHYKMITYANLGDYYRPDCGFRRPELGVQLTETVRVGNTSADFVIDGKEYDIAVDGMYNVYNTLAATAVAEHYQVTPGKIRTGLTYDEKVFGRQEAIKVNDKECTLVLVENPASLNQVIDMMGLAPYSFSLVSLSNTNYADGVDVSWTWDSNHETFADMDIPKIIAGGDRHEDIALRLEVTGIPEERLLGVPDLEQVVSEIKTLPTDHVYILATYTAVLQLRESLTARGYIQGGINGVQRISCLLFIQQLIKYLQR